MNNTFAKVSNSIVSRALSRFGSKPANSLSSKAKAAIGLGGLAGAGALAHHYDVLAPSTSRVIDEHVLPPLTSPTSTPSNAKKVLQELSRNTENISATKPYKDVRTFDSKLEPYVMDFVSGKDLEKVNPRVTSDPHSINSDYFLHDARNSVLASDHYGIPGLYHHGEREVLKELITARDAASFNDNEVVVRGLNQKINSILDILNSDTTRQSAIRNRVSSKMAPFASNTSDFPGRELLRILNYDLNPWGAVNARDIPIDTEVGRLFEDAKRLGKKVTYSYPRHYSLDSVIRGLDYDSALKQQADGVPFWRMPPHDIAGSYKVRHPLRPEPGLEFYTIGTDGREIEKKVLLEQIPRLKKAP